jgi:hypothetical protein
MCVCATCSDYFGSQLCTTNYLIALQDLPVARALPVLVVLFLTALDFSPIFLLNSSLFFICKNVFIATDNEM